MILGLVARIQNALAPKPGERGEDGYVINNGGWLGLLVLILAVIALGIYIWTHVDVSPKK